MRRAGDGAERGGAQRREGEGGRSCKGAYCEPGAGAQHAQAGADLGSRQPEKWCGDHGARVAARACEAPPQQQHRRVLRDHGREGGAAHARVETKDENRIEKDVEDIGGGERGEGRARVARAAEGALERHQAERRGEGERAHAQVCTRRRSHRAAGGQAKQAQCGAAAEARCDREKRADADGDTQRSSGTSRHFNVEDARLGVCRREGCHLRRRG